MTIEEAKKFLNGELIAVTIEHSVSSAAQKKRLESKFAKFAALNLAIGAIDKQIPKKPIEKSPWVYHCPRCDSQTIEEPFIKKFKFCTNCGQALDWSDSDD